MYSSSYPTFNPFHQQTTPSSYLPPLLASPASITSSSCSPSFEDEEEQPFSTVSTLCFDDGLSCNFDGILMECNNSNDSMASSNFDGIMADYLWDNCWHPAMENTTPIAHDDDEEIASSHLMWDHWLNAENQPHPLHFSSDDDDSPSINGVSAGSSTPSCISMSPGNFPGAPPASYDSSTPSCTSMSLGNFPGAPPASYDSSTPSCTSMLLGNFPGGLTGTPATSSGSFTSSQAMNNMYLQSSPYSEASSFASRPHLDLGACSNAVETTTNLTHEVEDNEEAVAIQVKWNTATLDDGYVWRKYGQKNIKGRRFPRSYYRCAQPGCQIRKQTESSSEMEGYVVMTYFGKHNHHRSD